jgi:uncharacterized protein YecE (DUF72 family)
MIRIGMAGWALPASHRRHFEGEGSHLARYARVFNATEINSCFYRAHLRSTYARWAASVPDGFRFSVKMPKRVTHELRLVGTEGGARRAHRADFGSRRKARVRARSASPELRLRATAASSFFAALRERYDGDVAVEPRHPTWFAPASTSVLEGFRCARVAADPARVPEAAQPGAWRGFAYWRLHGSPVMYRSSYADAFLQQLAANLCARGKGRSCMVHLRQHDARCRRSRTA